MDVYILCSIAVGILGLLCAIFLLKRNIKDKPRPQNTDNILPGARRRPIAGRSRRRVQDDEEDDEEPASTGNIDLPEGKIGAKKLAKLQAKAERKAHREQEERERAERKKKQEAEDEARRKAEEKENALEKQRLEEEKKLQEEKERKEYEEYLKIKEAFTVEAEGFDQGDTEGENTIQDFVNYIKANKVVVLEDLAAHFHLKTQQVIDRIQQLQSDDILSGVVDDRGKFIYISQEELDAVAKFVKQRGRVSINELVESSNLLINLTPALSN